MIPESKFAGLRIRNILLMILGYVLLTVFFYLRYTYGFERLIINLFLIICFAVLLLLVTVSRRIRGSINGNLSETHSGLMVFTLLMTASIIVYSFLPHYTMPFLFFSFFLTEIAGCEVALITTSFAAAFFTINASGSIYELAEYLILILVGAVLAPIYENQKARPAISFITFCFSVILPGIFSYIPAGQISLTVVIIAAVTGLVTDLLFILLFDKMVVVVKKQEERNIQDIVSDTYPLVREIRSFSPADYAHARAVSTLAAKCAGVAGLDADVAAAGGFYYRLGILGGEDVVQNGVLLAQLNCFPQAVITILAEYNGQENPISTPESAVVNLVNHLVSRFEHLKEQTSKSDWNREIVIYQTLNELSGSGLYDKSGLSINAYLQIREFLVRGDDL